MKTYLIIGTVRRREGIRWSVHLNDGDSGGKLPRISVHVTRKQAEAAIAELMRKDAESAG
jgi:hypothetical protein